MQGKRNQSAERHFFFPGFETSDPLYMKKEKSFFAVFARSNSKITGIQKLVLACILFVSASLHADTVTIHHIGVGQGDATLIIALQANSNGGYDTTSILIDAGNSSGKGKAVFQYIKTELGTTKHINYIITSHLHSDHIGGMPVLLDSLGTYKWNVNYILDRGATKQPLPDSCYSKIGYVDNDPVEPVDLPGSGIYKSYEDMIKKWFNGKRYNIQPGFDLFRHFGRPSNMSMQTVASNGCTLVTYDQATQNCPYIAKPDENDFSFVFLYMFDGFKYFTGGDIGGSEPYYDFETPIMKYFKTYPIMDFHCCVYKASHHGSANSSNADFIAYIEPALTVIPSALRSFSGTQLPGQTTITRCTTAGSKMSYTYKYDDTPYSGTVSAYKDVKFTITDPGYYKAITIPVYTRERSKSSPYAPTTIYTLEQTVVCDHYHDEIELDGLPASLAIASILPPLDLAVAAPKNGPRLSDYSACRLRHIQRLKKRAFRASQKAEKLMQK